MQWFANRHGAGVNFHLYYNRIPIKTMVYGSCVQCGTLSYVISILTEPCWQIENCLHEWQTGSFKPVDFTEKAYKAIYDAHLVTLTKWMAHPQGGAILA